MINKVILTGRITTDIELRRTNDGVPYTFFTVAVTRRINRDESDFIRCVAWRGTAEFMNQYLNKGSLVGIEGRLEVFSQQKDGEWETRTTVQVTQLDSLESKAQVEARTQEQRLNTNYQSSNNEQPMTFDGEAHIDQSQTTPVPEQSQPTTQVQEPEVINANDINLDDIKF